MPNHCVNCGSELQFYESSDLYLPVCVSTKCANYGILQTGIEMISEFVLAMGEEKNT